MGMPIINGVRADLLELRILVEHSKTLTKWTKVITVTTVALILFTIAQIVLIIIIAPY